MKEKCQVCMRTPRAKGHFYITTKLVSATTKLDGLKLCKTHSDRLQNLVWNTIFQYLKEGAKGE